MSEINFIVPTYIDSEDFDDYDENDFEEEFKKSFFSDNGDEYSSIAIKTTADILCIYSSEGGAPDIHFLQVEDFSIDLQSFIGSFNLQYEVHRTFGCADIDTREEDYFHFKFEIIDNEFHCSSANTIVSFSPE